MGPSEEYNQENQVTTGLTDRKVPAVADALDRQTIALKDQENLLTKLYSRLQPVLEPAPERDETAKRVDEPPARNIAEIIRRNENKIRENSMRISQMVERLEV